MASRSSSGREPAPWRHWALGSRALEGKAGALPGTAVGLHGPEDNHPDVLAAVIRQWLSDAALQAEWQAAALAPGNNLPGWDTTARDVLALLEAPGHEATGDGPAGPMPTATGTAGAQ